jgi:tRNA (cytidine/uridine-2'-O-)-methyltransferase
MKPRLVLYQPDIPQNTASFIRLSACLGLELHIIEPMGFIFDTKEMKRVMMDYFEKARIIRHSSWQQFLDMRQGESQGRLILMTTKASKPYTELHYKNDDYILFGRESSGVPEEVHGAADERVMIPMQEGARSLNVAMSAAMIAGEALRQL